MPFKLTHSPEIEGMKYNIMSYSLLILCCGLISRLQGNELYLCCLPFLPNVSRELAFVNPAVSSGLHDVVPHKDARNVSTAGLAPCIFVTTLDVSLLGSVHLDLPAAESPMLVCG